MHLMHALYDTCVARISSNGNNHISSKTKIRKPYWPLWAVAPSLWWVCSGPSLDACFIPLKKPEAHWKTPWAWAIYFGPLWFVFWLVGWALLGLVLLGFLSFDCLIWQDAMQKSTQMAWKFQRVTDSTKSLLGETRLIPSKVLWTIIHKSVVYIKI